MIPEAKISEIRERADIAEVVGEYVTLRRAGANLKGVCPFHADTDPSFSVNPARQFFHCFGCRSSGDVFGFLQRIEGIDFTEAATRLAARYSVELPEQKPMSRADRSKVERQKESSSRRRYILTEATAFFEKNLAGPSGQAAREVLKSRGIDIETAKKYRLGYALDAWSALLDHLGSSGIAPKEIEEVGLALPRRSGNGFYDRFRHRLMFTILDASGQPIAFSGRAIEDKSDDQGAKYINSPETKEYTKGKVLYGLYQARVGLSKTSEVILVEGNFDVVSMAQAGIDNVVAPLGTALTPAQAGLLRRRVERVIVIFDGDSAGRKAAARAFPILAGVGLASYVVPLPNGEDPDSLIRKEGIDAVIALLSKRKGLLDQIVVDSAAACDGSLQDAARRILKLKPYLDVLRTAIESDLYRQRIADAFRLDLKTVFRCLRNTGLKSRPDEMAEKGNKLPGLVEERELVGLLIDCPELFDDAITNGIVAMVITPVLKGLLDEFGRYSERNETSIADLVAKSDEEQVSHWLAERAMVCLYEDKDRAKQALEEIRTKLIKAHLKEKIQVLENQIHLANSKGDDMGVLELSRKKTKLQKMDVTHQSELFDVEAAKA